MYSLEILISALTPAKQSLSVAAMTSGNGVTDMPNMTSYVLIAAVAGGVTGFLLSGTLLLMKVLCAKRNKTAQFSVDRKLSWSSQSNHSVSDDDQDVERTEIGGSPRDAGTTEPPVTAPPPSNQVE